MTPPIRELTAGIKATAGAIRAVRAMVEGLKVRAADARRVAEARAMLGIQAETDAAYRSDSVHPLYTPDVIHPDNLAAVRAAAIADVKRAQDRDQLAIADDVRARLDSNLLLFGSPTSEGLSREVFGYTPVPGAQDALILDDLPLELPYRWHLNSTELASTRARRYVPGKGLVERPTWYIVSDLPGDQKLYVPQVNIDGLIQDDYLVVTRMRNFLAPGAWEAGRFLVSFGGAHGIGTRAIELLFKDRAVLGKIEEEFRLRHQLRRRPEAYQLLLQVGRVKHDRNLGSHARSIKLINGVVLPDSPEVWNTARAAVAPRISAWFAQSPPS